MRLLLLAISLLLPFTAASAVTLTLTQPDLTGLPGTTVGWGFSLENDTASYLVVTSVQSTFANAPLGLSASNPAVEDYLSNWMVNNSFALAPGATLTQAFSQALGEGLAAFAIAVGASGTEPGALIATYSLFLSDPFTDPFAVSVFPDPNPLSVNARVTVGGAAVPEPSSWLLMGAGLVWLVRRRVVVALGLAACVFGQLPGIDGVPADGAFPAPVVASGQSCLALQQPLAVRQEGTTERVGDLIATCTGKLGVNPRNRVSPVSATPATDATRVNVRVQLLSGTFTNRLVAGNLTDALLLHNEPSQATPCPSPDASGVCPGLVPLDSGAPGLTGVSAAGSPVTVFQGVLTAPNVIEFRGIPFSWIDGLGNPRLTSAYNFIKGANGGVYAGQTLDVPVTQFFRLKNFRVAASAFPVNTQIMASIAMNVIPTNNPVEFGPPGSPAVVVLGNVLQGFSRPPLTAVGSSVVSTNTPNFSYGAVGLPLGACVNRTLDTVNPSFHIRAQAGFPISAKARGFAPGNPLLDQNQGNFNYNTESGFYSTAFGATNGLNRAGIADTGTRYRFLFRNVPAGAQIYAPVSFTAAFQTIELVQTDATTSGASFPVDSFTPLTATNGGLRALAQRGADQLAVYEVTSQVPVFSSRLLVPFHVSHGAGVAPGTVTAESSMAPFLVEPVPAASSSLPLPRFGLGQVSDAAFTLQNCNSCGSTLNTAVSQRYGGNNGYVLWVVRLTNNGYSPVAGGVASLALTKVSGPGSVSSPASVAFAAILPGQSVDVPFSIPATDAAGTRVRAVFTYSGGCFATTHTLNFQPLL